jgi:hypothetical protein
MKYYPISRVVTGLISTGESLLLNGEPYTGPYYKTYDNKLYTGNDPVTGDSKPLSSARPTAGGSDISEFPVAMTYTIASTDSAKEYNILKNVNLPEQESFVRIKSFFPQPNSLDYQKGSITRYFAKRRNQGGFVVEINKDTYLSLQKPNSEYNYEMHVTAELFWQISGPLVDSVNTKTGIRTAGIVDTNKRLVESREVYFKGLMEFIGGKYSKFAKPVVV